MENNISYCLLVGKKSDKYSYFECSTKCKAAAESAAKEVSGIRGKPVILITIYSDWTRTVQYWNDKGPVRENGQEPVRTSIPFQDRTHLNFVAHQTDAKAQLAQECDKECKAHLQLLRDHPDHVQDFGAEIYRHAIMEGMSEIISGDFASDAEARKYSSDPVISEKTAICILGTRTPEQNVLDFLYDCWANTDLGIQDAIEECLSGVHQVFEDEIEPVPARPSLQTVLNDAEQRRTGFENTDQPRENGLAQGESR